MLGRLSCPCLFLCTLLISVANDLPPLHLSARGDGFFREGRKGGEGKVEVPARFARHPSFVPDEKIRMKHRASTSFMRAWRKHQTGSRPDFPRDNVASDRIRREERSSALELKFRWFVEDALCIYGYVYVCVCVYNYAHRVAFINFVCTVFNTVRYTPFKGKYFGYNFLRCEKKNICICRKIKRAN